MAQYFYKNHQQRQTDKKRRRKKWLIPWKKNKSAEKNENSIMVIALKMEKNHEGYEQKHWTHCLHRAEAYLLERQLGDSRKFFCDNDDTVPCERSILWFYGNDSHKEFQVFAWHTWAREHVQCKRKTNLKCNQFSSAMPSQTIKYTCW